MGSIHGGWLIVNQASSGCTLGFPARRATTSSAPVFVTNSHCTLEDHEDDGGAFAQSGTIIGYEIKDPDGHLCGFPVTSWCRESDAALISAIVPIQLGRIARTTESSGCESCNPALTIDHSSPTLQITGRKNYNVWGETLHKIGSTTGWTYGVIESTCADWQLPPVVGWRRLCSDRVDYQSEGGDSGSPVFVLKADGTVELRGIHFGSIPWPYTDGVMSPLGQIEKDLGPLTVYDPGPPQVSIGGPVLLAPNLLCTWTADIVKGIPPFVIEWSGLFSGDGPEIQGVATSGDLYVMVRDADGRQVSTMVGITVGPGYPYPPGCTE
jgi:hypothetical protein